jgi:2-dehydropantoate 2-reductase
MDRSLESLRIAVLGAGKIGSTFAAQLARVGGHDVTVIARPGSIRLQQLERDRAIIDVKGVRSNVRVAAILDETIAYDLVIVTLLSHQADALLPALQRCAATCIQFMFNTFHPERLQDAIGVGRCEFGMPFVQATLDGDGRLKATIGAGGQKTIMSQQRWADVFNRAGLPAAFEPDMPLWLRCHVPLCVAFESVSVAGERRGGGSRGSRKLPAHQTPGISCPSTVETAYRRRPDIGGCGGVVGHVAHSAFPCVIGDGGSRMPRARRRHGGIRAARHIACHHG